MKNINTMRVFFAVLLSNTVHDPLSKLIATLKNAIGNQFIRWAPITHLHVTLQFLKGLRESDLITLIELVRAQLKNISNFQLQLEHLTIFPTSKNTKIIALAVEPNTILMTLSNKIGQAMSVLGYPIDSRPFQGHITLARLKHDEPQTNLFSHVDIPPILIQSISLIESRPDKEGSHYIQLAQFDLNQAT